MPADHHARPCEHKALGALRLGLLIAILFGVAVINDWSAIDGLIIALLVVLLVSYLWSRLSLQRLGYTRTIETDRVRVGETISERMALVNHSILPKLWVEVRDMATVPGHPVGKVVNLGSKRRHDWEVATPALQRGRFRLGPLSISSGDPLGLFQERKTLPATYEIICYPAAIDTSSVPLPGAMLTGGQMATRRLTLESPMTSGVREYAPGDPLNHISWTATARRGSMMVKEFDPDPTSDLWVLIDLNEDGSLPLNVDQSHVSRSSDPRSLLDSTEEYVVSIGASLTERALHEGRKVGLVVNRSLPVRIHAENSERQWLRIFEILAVATAFGHRDLAEAIALESPHLSRNAGIVIVTASPSRSWVDAARMLTMRQVPVTAVLVEPLGDTMSMSGLEQELISAHVSVKRYATVAAALPYPQSDESYAFVEQI